MAESPKNEGAIFVEDLSEVPPLAVTVSSAHGVARSVEEEAADAAYVCSARPTPWSPHNQGERCISKGRTMILVGHAGHPVVAGTKGRVPASVLPVQNIADLKAPTLPEGSPVAYIR